MEKTEKISDKYTKRRTVTAHEPTDVMVRDIGHLDERTVGIIVDVAGDDFIIEVPVKDKNYLSEFIKHIPESISDIDKIEGKIISMVFDENMEKCGFSKENYIFNIELIKDLENKFIDKDIMNTIHNSLLKEKYRDSEINGKEGYELYISDVEEINEEEFIVKAFDEVGSEIEWELNLPITTEKQASQISKLIEEQGGGDPGQLVDAGKIIIVHQEDVDRNLDIIKYDKETEWAMVVPSTHKNWEKYTPPKESKYTKKQKTQYQKFLKIRNKYTRAMLFNLASLPMFSLISNSLMDSTEQTTETGQMLTQTMEQLVSMTSSLMLLMATFSFIVIIAMQLRLKSISEDEQH